MTSIEARPRAPTARLRQRCKRAIHVPQLVILDDEQRAPDSRPRGSRHPPGAGRIGADGSCCHSCADRRAGDDYRVTQGLELLVPFELGGHVSALAVVTVLCRRARTRRGRSGRGRGRDERRIALASTDARGCASASLRLPHRAAICTTEARASPGRGGHRVGSRLLSRRVGSPLQRAWTRAGLAGAAREEAMLSGTAVVANGSRGGARRHFFGNRLRALRGAPDSSAKPAWLEGEADGLAHRWQAWPPCRRGRRRAPSSGVVGSAPSAASTAPPRWEPGTPDRP